LLVPLATCLHVFGGLCFLTFCGRRLAGRVFFSYESFVCNAVYWFFIIYVLVIIMIHTNIVTTYKKARIDVNADKTI
jgi:heme/copper-type cytochrome/quinol oxidase subunit 3